MKLPKIASGLLFCCTVVLAGCGDDNGLVPVRGRVLLDNQPVEGAAVMFQPDKGVPATATTNAEGEFEMSTPQGKGRSPRHEQDIGRQTGCGGLQSQS